jgi:hypothetical protein
MRPPLRNIGTTENFTAFLCVLVVLAGAILAWMYIAGLIPPARP